MTTAVVDFDTRAARPSARPHRADGVAAARAEQRRPVRAQRSESWGSVRLTPRGRLVVLVAALAASFGVFAMVSGPADSTAERHHPAAEQVVVEPGQTLWDIATEIAPDADPRVVIDEIVDLNSLESSGSVRAGQPLYVPQY